jgi:hypothetical protein
MADANSDYASSNENMTQHPTLERNPFSKAVFGPENREEEMVSMRQYANMAFSSG